MVRIARRYAVIALGALLATILVVNGGLLLDSHWWNEFPNMRPVILLTGCTAIVAGSFVFVVIVADRLFPRVQAQLAMWTELTLAGLFLAGFAASITIVVGISG
ncbi:MAG: hypothetical protein ACF8GE_00860 [Phycisphaerales bacterium JB043]